MPICTRCSGFTRKPIGNLCKQCRGSLNWSKEFTRKHTEWSQPMKPPRFLATNQTTTMIDDNTTPDKELNETSEQLDKLDQEQVADSSAEVSNSPGTESNVEKAEDVQEEKEDDAQDETEPRS